MTTESTEENICCIENMWWRENMTRKILYRLMTRQYAIIHPDQCINRLLYFSWRNMRSSVANCRPKRIQTRRCSRWSSSPRITSSPSQDSGISCANCVSSRRQLARLFPWSASTRRRRWRSRTSAFGCVTTRGRAHTTCTASTATWPSAEPSLSATVTWPPAIALALIQSR